MPDESLCGLIPEVQPALIFGDEHTAAPSYFCLGIHTEFIHPNRRAQTISNEPVNDQFLKTFLAPMGLDFITDCFDLTPYGRLKIIKVLPYAVIEPAVFFILGKFAIGHIFIDLTRVNPSARNEFVELYNRLIYPLH